MEFNNISTTQINPVSTNKLDPQKAKDLGQGPSFKEALNSQAQNIKESQKLNTGIAKLKFSNHAVDRMRARGLSYSPEQMTRIEGAIKKAADKGSRETLVLTDDSALVVSVKNNTVVTVMDKNSLKENVFTNIDSTVVI